MSIFSSIFKGIKKIVGKVAPILGSIAPFIPGLGPIAGILGPLAGGLAGGAVARAPPQRVMPGIGAVGPPVARRGIGAAAQTGRGFRVPTARRAGLRSPAESRAIMASLPQLPSSRAQQMSLFGAAGALGRAAGPLIRAGTRALGGRAGAVGVGAVGAATLIGGGAPDEVGRCPVGFHLNKQDGVGGPAFSYCVRNRRMNVGNARAARRSVRRLKGARKLLKDIEKMMPSKPRARRLAAPHLPAPHQH